MWFKYHRADGTRVANETSNPAADDDVQSEFRITPRLTLGYVRDDGLGFRVRYWKFDHTLDGDVSEGDSITVDTWTIDAEVFDTFCLNRNWDLEISAGIRYCEFREDMNDNPGGENILRRNEFQGWGGVASVELRRLVSCNTAMFVRARGAILMDDKDVLVDIDGTILHDVTLKDTVCGMTELAIGLDYVMSRCDGSYYFARVQAEWQNWYNFSSAFRTLDDAGQPVDESFSGPSDVGFGGFGFAFGVMR
jgi:hypothetical protein